MNRNILATGASGLIGSYAVKALHKEGYFVTALYRKPEAEYPWRAIQGDLLDNDTIMVLRSIDFDSVVHCAAMLPGQFHGENADHVSQLNLQIDERIVNLCQRKNCQLVYMSGTSVYGYGNGSHLTEEADLSPIGPYAEAKAKSERRILDELSNHSIILRVSAPYGPGQRTRTVLRVFIERALADLDLMYHGSGKRQQDFTAAHDVADAIVCAVSKMDVNGIFNISNGNPISMRDLAELVVRVLSSKSRIVPSGRPDSQEDYRALFDISKASRILRWHPTVSLEKGICQWAEYLRKNK
jgi:nucleoside-diphosphate-sugar epimerase